MKSSLRVLAGMLLMVSLAVFITTCGGGAGGGDDGDGVTDTDVDSGATGTISGSVAGTTVVAVNDSGDIVASDDTTGKTSDANGNFPFILTEIPAGVNIRVYLITKGGIYPMYFDNDGDGIPDTNVFLLASAADIDFGFVDTDVVGQEGMAIPENDLTDTSGVSAGSENPDIPPGLIKPDTAEFSCSQLLSEGFTALKQGLALKAKDYFGTAVDLCTSRSDLDTANFFYALIRVAALGFDTYSDGNSTDMNKLGDILDRVGCDTPDTKRANLDAISCPDETMPDNSPTNGDMQDFLYNVVRPELIGAIANFDSVSESFNIEWTEPFDSERVESDYGDALFFRAGIKGVLASLLIQYAYDLEADIDETVNTDKTIELFLDVNPNFLTLIDNSKLTGAKEYLTASAIDLKDAIDWIQAETDSQDNDLINLLDTTLDEIAEAKDAIATARKCLNDGTCTVDNNTPSNTDDDSIINLNPFFAGIDLESFLPDFAGDDPTGFLPDPTFDDVLIKLEGNTPGDELNKDSDNDGTADIFDDYTVPFYSNDFESVH